MRLDHRILIGGVVAMLLPALSQAALSQAAAASAVPRASIAFPLSDVVGPVRAGLLCLPNGNLHGRDFLRSDADLSVRLQDVMAEGDQTDLGTLTIRLQALSAKLCAKSWGVMGIGDRKALSGKAEFAFAWSTDPTQSSPDKVTRITVRLGKGQAMPPDEIMQEALRRLVVEIRQQLP